jgi:alkaline ceramidase TOD1/glycosyltransferase MUCI70-like protein
MRTVLYTALFGGSDRLKPAPDGPGRCVCFTDDPTLSGPGWTMTRWTVASPRRAARALKTDAHRLFPAADLIVWADASMTITDWPRLLRDVGDAELACLPHPDRSTCYDEGQTVVRLALAAPTAIARALAGYRAAGFAPTRLSTTGLLVRRQTAAVAAFNDLWQAELDRYGTTRDQVHVDYCAWIVGIPVTYLTGQYRQNPYMVYDQQDHQHRRQPEREGVA